jgi:hypothetical protein
MKKWLEGNRPVKLAGLIYTIIAVVIVATAWATNLYAGDLSLTISAYIGLRFWTVVAYLISAILIDFLIFYFIAKTPMLKLKKIIYTAVFSFVLGCALFPYGEQWGNISPIVHNICAFSLLGSSTIALFVAIIKPNTKNQRRFTIGAFIYALFFATTYAILGWKPVLATLFIWENLFIYVQVIELCFEKPQNQ